MATQGAAAKKQQDLQMQYSTYKNTIQQLAQKIGDIEQERDEHIAVLDTLAPLSGDRKCFRMINGVLVEMKVKDALPPLKTNTDGLKTVEKDLKEQLFAKQKELDEWKVCLARALSFIYPLKQTSADRRPTTMKKKNNVQVVQ